MADSAGHMVLLKHIEFVWFHYDLLLRCGENRHRNLTAALYEGAASLVLFFACRRSSESQHSFKMFASGPCAPPFQISTACSPEADSPSGPSTGEHFQIRWVPENLFRGCTPSSNMLYSISMEWKLLVWRERPIFRHALLNSDGVKSTCLVGTPHPQTCSAKFRWSEINLSGGNTPQTCSAKFRWSEIRF